MAKSYEALRAKLPAASRKKAAEQTRAMLADIRRQEKLTQAALADALGVSQVAISKLERQGDMTIGTLRRYVEAAGGQLDIVARLPKGKLRLDHLGK